MWREFKRGPTEKQSLKWGVKCPSSSLWRRHSVDIGSIERTVIAVSWFNMQLWRSHHSNVGFVSYAGSVWIGCMPPHHRASPGDLRRLKSQALPDGRRWNGMDWRAAPPARPIRQARSPSRPSRPQVCDPGNRGRYSHPPAMSHVTVTSVRLKKSMWRPLKMRHLIRSGTAGVRQQEEITGY